MALATEMGWNKVDAAFVSELEVILAPERVFWSNGDQKVNLGTGAPNLSCLPLLRVMRY